MEKRGGTQGGGGQKSDSCAAQARHFVAEINSPRERFSHALYPGSGWPWGGSLSRIGQAGPLSYLPRLKRTQDKSNETHLGGEELWSQVECLTRRQGSVWEPFPKIPICLLPPSNRRGLSERANRALGENNGGHTRRADVGITLCPLFRVHMAGRCILPQGKAECHLDAQPSREIPYHATGKEKALSAQCQSRRREALTQGQALAPSRHPTLYFDRFRVSREMIAPVAPAAQIITIIAAINDRKSWFVCPKRGSRHAEPGKGPEGKARTHAVRGLVPKDGDYCVRALLLAMFT